MKNLLPLLLIGAALGVSAEPWVKGDPSRRPTLFKQFGDVLNTPDGLALDVAGNVYLSAVNGVDGSYPGHIWRMEKATGKWSVFTPCKPHPKTHAAYPMGLAFDPDGNLYYADAQYFADPGYQSRIMRVVIRNGEPQRIETVVEHVKLPNALRWRDGADGLIDQPCEVLMLDANRVLVVNIDAPSPFMVNTKPDPFHTLSVISFEVR
jgi:hypothetical protein